MSVATLRYIACPDCGDTRPVSDRHARRLNASDADLRCDTCRNPRPTEPGNDDIVFWLQWAGISLPAGASGFAYIRVFGLPEKLHQLIGDLNGSVRYLP